MRLLLLVCFIIFFNLKNSIAQSINEIQIGASYNTCRKFIVSHVDYSYHINYNIWNLNPVIRYNYIICCRKNNIQKSSLNLFAGYHSYGGIGAYPYIPATEKIKCHALEIGAMPNLRIIKHVFWGLGAKFNYSPISILRYHPGINQNGAMSWTTERVTEKNRSLTCNLGTTLKFRFNSVSLAFEAWFGLMPINKPNHYSFGSYNANIVEDNFRAIVGYTLPTKKHK